MNWFCYGRIGQRGPEPLRHLPNPHSQGLSGQSVARSKRQEQSADCQAGEVVEFKKIRDSKGETGALGVGRGRSPAPYLKYGSWQGGPGHAKANQILKGCLTIDDRDGQTRMCGN
jgi:hypothetical protein